MINKKIKEGLGTKRFRYSIMLFALSIAGLVILNMTSQQAYDRAAAIEKDPRFDASSWADKTADEKTALSNEKMSALINLGQVKMGKDLFAITLTLSFILFIMAFIPLKSKADRMIEKMSDGEDSTD